MTRRWKRWSVLGLTLGLVGLGSVSGAEHHEPHANASPQPGATPVARDRDPASGAPGIGVGRADGAVKSSGDEGGTAAGMPGNGPDVKR